MHPHGDGIPARVHGNVGRSSAARRKPARSPPLVGRRDIPGPVQAAVDREYGHGIAGRVAGDSDRGEGRVCGEEVLHATPGSCRRSQSRGLHDRRGCREPGPPEDDRVALGIDRHSRETRMMAGRREIERRRPRVGRGHVSCSLDAMMGSVESPPDRDHVARCVDGDFRPARLTRHRSTSRGCPRLRCRDVARRLDDRRGPFPLCPDGRRIALSIHGQARAGGYGSGEHRRRHRGGVSGPPLLPTCLERPDAAPQQCEDDDRPASGGKVDAHGRLQTGAAPRR